MSGKIPLLCAIALLAAAGTAQAGAVLYVRASGSDALDGLSPATALRTIGAAARRLAYTNGQVIVGPGTYAEGDIAPRSGTVKYPPPDPLEFIADRDGSRTGDMPGPVLVDATGWDTGFLVDGEANVRIDGFYVRGSSEAGIEVRYNWQTKTPPANMVITNCVLFSNLKYGIDVHGTVGGLIFNNLTYANGWTGINVGDKYRGSSDVVIAHNTSYGNGSVGIMVGYGNRSPVGELNITVLSNVVDGNGRGGIKIASASRDTYSGAFNIVGDSMNPSRLMDQADIQADPLLANPEGADGVLGGDGFEDDDFRLLPGSPALDHGPAGVATIGLTGGSSEDGTRDEGVVDAGYHYGNTATSYAIPSLPSVTLFVRTSGSDGNDGSTPDHALRTIGHAAEVARPGVTVVVGPGVYAEGNIAPQRSGSRLRPIVFTADETGEQTGDHSGPVLVDARGQGWGFFIQKYGHVVVDGFSVTGGSDAGIIVKSGAHDVNVANCRVFSNAGHGIAVQDAKNITVFNNLSYANGQDGVLLTGFVSGVSNAEVVNNTVYGNNGRGVFLGASLLHPVSDVMALNNIAAANGVAGIQVGSESLLRMNVASNLNADRYAYDTVADVTDMQANPLFVNPAGSDGKLGGGGFADDDFHLSDRRSGQGATSPAIDAGSDAATSLNLARASAIPNDGGDRRWVDMGFHYGNHTWGPSVVRIPYEPLYVSPNGNDGNSGIVPSQAFRTITHAARVARKGNVVIVAAGTYREGDINPINSGVGFKAARPGTVVIDATGFSAAFRIATRSSVSVDGFVLTGGAAGGVYVKSGSRGTEIRNNIIQSNPGHGVYVQDASDTTVFNNLIYSNGKDGVVVRGKAHADDIVVKNNTLYANANNGIHVGDAIEPITNVHVTNNISAANALTGLDVLASSWPTFVGDYNLVADGYSARHVKGRHDQETAPGFVDPSGPDRVLGGLGFADDDFRLAQPRGGQTVTSAAVDAGSTSAKAASLGGMSTTASGLSDVGVADIGFHYPR